MEKARVGLRQKQLLQMWDVRDVGPSEEDLLVASPTPTPPT